MLLMLGGSAIAVLVLAGVAWALGLGGGTIDNEAQAIEAAENALGGFTGQSAVIGTDHRSALVRGQDGRFALVKLSGARVAVRGLVEPIACHQGDAGLIIDSQDRWFGRVQIQGMTALAELTGALADKHVS